MQKKEFKADVITPSGTPLGGWVHLGIEDSGNYRIHFHMHSSSIAGNFDYYLRAYLSAPDCPTFVFAHRGHVSGVNDEDLLIEKGYHPLLASYAAPLKQQGTFRVAKEYGWGGPVGLGLKLLSGAGEVASSLGTLVASTPEAIEGFLSSLGPGATFGVLGGAVVFVAGTALGGPAGSVLIQSWIAGVAVGAATNALIKSRPLSAEEAALCRRVFGRTLPVERVLLTNLSGQNGRAFVAPGVDGKIYCNLGEAYGNPLRYTNNAYRTPGQVFVHELTHAWQIVHTTFVPGLVCEGILNQAKNTIQGNLYNPGLSGADWSRYNLEQQGSIVDRWFAGQRGGDLSAHRPMDSEHPYYRYLRDSILGGAAPEGAPFRLGTVQAITEPGNRTGLYLERKNGGVFTKFFPDSKKPGSWSEWIPLDSNRFPQDAAVSAVSARTGDTGLYVVGVDGKVWSKFFPDPKRPGNWSPWFPQGENLFPIGSPIATLSAKPGETALFLIGLDGKVWTRFFPDVAKSGQWSPWFPLGDNLFPNGSPIATLSAKPGETALYVIGFDGKVWSKFFPDPSRPGSWSPWFPQGENTFPLGATVTALSAKPGETALFVVGLDGKVWTRFFPDVAKSGQWSPWFALGDNVFPVGAPVSAVSTRTGDTALYVVGLDGKVWSKFFPDPSRPGNWTPWFKQGENSFPLGSTVTAVSSGPGATSLYVLDKDEQVWTNYFPAQPGRWSGWLKL